MFSDIQRVAIIGAKAQIGRMPFGQQRGQRVQLLAHRPFADQDPHPLAQFFQPYFCRRRLMFGADPGGDIAVQVIAAQQGGVAVNMAAPERL